jgi:hypothetical protein
MNLLGIQILAILFALFMLYVNFINYKRRRIEAGASFLWTSLWLGFVTVALFPQLLEPILKPLNISRVLDLLMLIAFAILTVVSFDNYLRNRDIEGKIEKLVRKEALRKVKKK